jgi:hypothetical protein
MPREPEGKILNFLGVIPIDLRIARNPSELQFSRKAGTSVAQNVLREPVSLN